jgi:hypothetical protein
VVVDVSGGHLYDIRCARKDRSSTFARTAPMEMVDCSLAAGPLAPRQLPRRARRPPPAPSVLAGRVRLRVRSEKREQPPAVRASGPERASRSLGQAAAGLAAAAVVSLTGVAGDVSPLPPAPAQAESLTVAFPVSKAREVGSIRHEASHCGRRVPRKMGTFGDFLLFVGR